MPTPFTSIYFDDPIVPQRVFDILEPRNVTRDIAFFFVHGGGWQAGHREGHHVVMRELNARGFLAAATDYRLAGVTALDQLADVRHGYRLFVDRLKEAGRPTRIVVYGCSAGAHLAALLSLALPGQCGEALTVGEVSVSADDWVRPEGVALQSTPVTFEPWEDIFPHIWTTMQRIAGRPYNEAPELYRALSPIEYVNDNSPAVFLMNAENEHIFSNELEARFADKLEDLGRPVRTKLYPRVEHGFFYALDRWQQREALEDLVSFAAWVEAGCR